MRAALWLLNCTMDQSPSATPRVCVVGSLNMDLVIRTPRIPLAGETILGGGYRTYAGGKGANQAVAAARLGAEVSLIGCVGLDQHALKVREALEREKLDISGVDTRAQAATGLALITVAEGGENAIVVAPGANAEVSVELIEQHRGKIEMADVLLMQLEIPNAAVIAAAKIAKGSGRAVILNAAPARVLPADLLKLIDVLVVNKSEAARIMGLDANLDPARLALRLPDMGPPTALLTLGAHGAILAHKGRPRRVPPAVVKSIDAVGAGDAFCGALATWWAGVHEAIRKRDPNEFRLVEEAAIAASVAGSLATTKHGAIPSMPERSEVIAAMSGLKCS